MVIDTMNNVGKCSRRQLHVTGSGFGSQSQVPDNIRAVFMDFLGAVESTRPEVRRLTPIVLGLGHSRAFWILDCFFCNTQATGNVQIFPVVVQFGVRGV